jgi:hypothetical protein
MNGFGGTRCSRGGALPAWFLVGALLFGVLGTADRAVAENLNELLSQVGEEYAIAYSSPFLYSFGPNANANMYSTAHIPWGGITFGLGIKAMGTKINDADRTFSKVVHDVDVSQYYSSIAPGTLGDVHLSGPTIFGDTKTNGMARVYVNGILAFEAETIPGLVDSEWSPFATPEFYIGGVVGLKLTVRYLPEIDTGDYGKTKYLGYGLQWNANGVLKNLPLDLMAGFFTQQINVGSIYESTASSFFVGASKGFSVLTAYGGFALESSELDVSYVFDEPGDLGGTSQVDFTVEGLQDTRFTLGVTLNILLKFNLEAGFGNEMTTYSAGLMFGL